MAFEAGLPHGNPRAFRVSLREDVLASNTWDVALVPRDVLKAHLMHRASDPVVGEPAMVAEDVQVGLVLADDGIAP